MCYLLNDYAAIEDFNSEGEDKIQLGGEVANYSLGASPELIAIAVDIEPDALNLSNSEQFVFEI